LIGSGGGDPRARAFWAYLDGAPARARAARKPAPRGGKGA